jgi:hypothetical protein
VKLMGGEGGDVKLKQKPDGWKIEDGSDQLLAKIKRKGAEYVLEVNGVRTARVSTANGSAEVRDSSGTVLFKGSGLGAHAELAVALAMPEAQLGRAQRAAMLAWMTQ